EWLEFIKRYTFDTDSVLVGHSLGTVLIFRFLELRSRPVGHVYLAAPLDEDLGIAELRQSEFFAAPFDWEKIKHSAKSFSLFYSDDDPYIGVPMFERVAVHLGARQYFLPGRGHFNSQAWPELFEAIIAQRNNEAKKQ
ncbi:MAG: alpha/beta hydrolase, partial [Candidatus Magasanikbacteria bacterium]|nr:alpha/beta hydrolase [Candidatus Magasanikbacteria bacterium]